MNRSERDELARLAAEVQEAAPFLELAREIRAEVQRVSADDSASGDMLEDAIERIPARERSRLALSASTAEGVATAG